MPLNKKRYIRKLRTTARKNPNGKVSSHVMAWVGDPSKKRGNFAVFPTISPKKGKENSSKYEDWKEQSPEEAEAKGELIKVRSRRRAQKLAAGSWKKGSDKRDAMKKYKKLKKHNHGQI